MNKKQLLTLATAAMFCVSPAFAITEYWVATNGSDENPGTQDKPFEHPEMAIAAVLPNEETIIHLQKDATFRMAGQLDLGNNKICTVEGDNTTLLGAEKPGNQGGEAVRIFRAADGSKVTVRGINFENGRQVEYVLGGAIYFAGDELNVENCRFINNEAGSAGAGIGSRGRVVRVKNCYFEGNYTIGGGSRGACIMQRGTANMDGELYVDNCTFYKNDMTNGGQGICIAIYDPSNQPGVNFTGTKKVVVTNSTFVSNTSSYSYQGCIDVSEGGACATYLVNNTFYDNDGALRFDFQDGAPICMFNNFVYANRAAIFTERSVKETERQSITARNNILYGAERAVNEFIDDADLNANAAACHNTLGLCKDATMVGLGVSTSLSTNQGGFVPYLPILRENSPLVNAGIENSAEWTDGENFIPATDCRGYAAKGTKDIGAFEYGTAGVQSVAADFEADPNAPVEYFNLQGIRVANPENGIFIRRQGNKATKVRL